jgi:hypothetical protein
MTTFQKFAYPTLILAGILLKVAAQLVFATYQERGLRMPVPTQLFIAHQDLCIAGFMAVLVGGLVVTVVSPTTLGAKLTPLCVGLGTGFVVLIGGLLALPFVLG